MSNGDRFRGLVRASRIQHWSVHLGVFTICGALYGLSFDRVPHDLVENFWRVLVLQLLLYPAAYLVNDRVDFEDDRFKEFAVVQRRFRPPVWVLGLLFGLSLVWAIGACHRWALVVWVFLSTAAITYSTPPFRLKVRGLAGVGTAALAQRLPFFILLCVGVPLRLAPALWIVGYLAMLGLLFILNHQAEDLDLDRAAGVRTWAVNNGRMVVFHALLAIKAAVVLWAAALWLVTVAGSGSWVAPVRFSVGATVLVILTLALFHRRYGGPVRYRALSTPTGNGPVFSRDPLPEGAAEPPVGVP